MTICKDIIEDIRHKHEAKIKAKRDKELIIKEDENTGISK